MKRFALKRITALVLALVMTLSLLPMNVWAEELQTEYAPLYWKDYNGAYNNSINVPIEQKTFNDGHMLDLYVKDGETYSAIDKTAFGNETITKLSDNVGFVGWVVNGDNEELLLWNTGTAAGGTESGVVFNVGEVKYLVNLKVIAGTAEEDAAGFLKAYLYDWNAQNYYTEVIFDNAWRFNNAKDPFDGMSADRQDAVREEISNIDDLLAAGRFISWALHGNKYGGQHLIEITDETSDRDIAEFIGAYDRLWNTMTGVQQTMVNDALVAIGGQYTVDEMYTVATAKQSENDGSAITGVPFDSTAVKELSFDEVVAILKDETEVFNFTKTNTHLDTLQEMWAFSKSVNEYGNFDEIFQRLETDFGFSAATGFNDVVQVGWFISGYLSNVHTQEYVWEARLERLATTPEELGHAYDIADSVFAANMCLTEEQRDLVDTYIDTDLEDAFTLATTAIESAADNTVVNQFKMKYLTDYLTKAQITAENVMLIRNNVDGTGAVNPWNVLSGERIFREILSGTQQGAVDTICGSEDGYYNLLRLAQAYWIAHLDENISAENALAIVKSNEIGTLLITLINNALLYGRPVQLAISAVVAENMGAADKEALNNAVPSGYEVENYQDLGVTVTVDGQTTDVTQTNGEVTVEVGTAESGKKYKVLRNHNGTVEEVPVIVENGKIYAKSDKFSSYALLSASAPSVTSAPWLHGVSVLTSAGESHLGYFVPTDWDGVYLDSNNVFQIPCPPIQDKMLYLATDSTNVTLAPDGTWEYASLKRSEKYSTALSTNVYELVVDGQDSGSRLLKVKETESTEGGAVTENTMSFQFNFEGYHFTGVYCFTKVDNEGHLTYYDHSSCDGLGFIRSVNGTEERFSLRVPFVSGQGKALYLRPARGEITSMSLTGGNLAEGGVLDTTRAIFTAPVNGTDYYTLTLTDAVTENCSAYIELSNGIGVDIQFVVESDGGGNGGKPFTLNGLEVYTNKDQGKGTYHDWSNYDGLGITKAGPPESQFDAVRVPYTPGQEKKLFLKLVDSNITLTSIGDGCLFKDFATLGAIEESTGIYELTLANTATGGGNVWVGFSNNSGVDFIFEPQTGGSDNMDKFYTTSRGNSVIRVRLSNEQAKVVSLPDKLNEKDELIVTVHNVDNKEVWRPLLDDNMNLAVCYEFDELNVAENPSTATLPDVFHMSRFDYGNLEEFIDLLERDVANGATFDTYNQFGSTRQNGNFFAWASSNPGDITILPTDRDDTYGWVFRHKNADGSYSYAYDGFVMKFVLEEGADEPIVLEEIKYPAVAADRVAFVPNYASAHANLEQVLSISEYKNGVFTYAEDGVLNYVYKGSETAFQAIQNDVLAAAALDGFKPDQWGVLFYDLLNVTAPAGYTAKELWCSYYKQSFGGGNTMTLRYHWRGASTDLDFLLTWVDDQGNELVEKITIRMPKVEGGEKWMDLVATPVEVGRVEFTQPGADSGAMNSYTANNLGVMWTQYDNDEMVDVDAVLASTVRFLAPTIDGKTATHYQLCYYGDGSDDPTLNLNNEWLADRIGFDSSYMEVVDGGTHPERIRGLLKQTYGEYDEIVYYYSADRHTRGYFVRWHFGDGVEPVTEYIQLDTSSYFCQWKSEFGKTDANMPSVSIEDGEMSSDYAFLLTRIHPQKENGKYFFELSVVDDEGNTSVIDQGDTFRIILPYSFMGVDANGEAWTYAKVLAADMKDPIINHYDDTYKKLQGNKGAVKGTFTEKGIEFVVDSFSPFMLTWNDPNAPKEEAQLYIGYENQNGFEWQDRANCPLGRTSSFKLGFKANDNYVAFTADELKGYEIKCSVGNITYDENGVATWNISGVPNSTFGTLEVITGSTVYRAQMVVSPGYEPMFLVDERGAHSGTWADGGQTHTFRLYADTDGTVPITPTDYNFSVTNSNFIITENGDAVDVTLPFATRGEEYGYLVAVAKSSAREATVKKYQFEITAFNDPFRFAGAEIYTTMDEVDGGILLGYKDWSNFDGLFTTRNDGGGTSVVVPFESGEGKTVYMVAPNGITPNPSTGGMVMPTVTPVAGVANLYKVTLGTDVTYSGGVWIEFRDDEGNYHDGIDMIFDCGGGGGNGPMGSYGVEIFTSYHDQYGICYDRPDWGGVCGGDGFFTVSSTPGEEDVLYLISQNELSQPSDIDVANGDGWEEVTSVLNADDSRRAYKMTIKAQNDGAREVEVPVNESETLTFTFHFDAFCYLGGEFYTKMTGNAEDGYTLGYVKAPAEFDYLHVYYDEQDNNMMLRLPYEPGAEATVYVKAPSVITDMKIEGGGLENIATISKVATFDGYNCFAITLPEGSNENGGVVFVQSYVSDGKAGNFLLCFMPNGGAGGDQNDYPPLFIYGKGQDGNYNYFNGTGFPVGGVQEFSLYIQVQNSTTSQWEYVPITEAGGYILGCSDEILNDRIMWSTAEGKENIAIVDTQGIALDAEKQVYLTATKDDTTYGLRLFLNPGDNGDGGGRGYPTYDPPLFMADAVGFYKEKININVGTKAVFYPQLPTQNGLVPLETLTQAAVSLEPVSDALAGHEQQVGTFTVKNDEDGKSYLEWDATNATANRTAVLSITYEGVAFKMFVHTNEGVDETDMVPFDYDVAGPHAPVAKITIDNKDYYLVPVMVDNENVIRGGNSSFNVDENSANTFAYTIGLATTKNGTDFTLVTDSEILAKLTDMSFTVTPVEQNENEEQFYEGGSYPLMLSVDGIKSWTSGNLVDPLLKYNPNAPVATMMFDKSSSGVWEIKASAKVEGTVYSTAVYKWAVYKNDIFVDVPEEESDPIAMVNTALQELAANIGANPDMDLNNTQIVINLPGGDLFGIIEVPGVVYTNPETGEGKLFPDVIICGNQETETVLHGGIYAENQITDVRLIRFIGAGKTETVWSEEAPANLSGKKNYAIWGDALGGIMNCAFTGYDCAVESTNGTRFGGNGNYFYDNNVALRLDVECGWGGNVAMREMVFAHNTVALKFDQFDSEIDLGIYTTYQNIFYGNGTDAALANSKRSFFMPSNVYDNTNGVPRNFTGHVYGDPYYLLSEAGRTDLSIANIGTLPLGVYDENWIQRTESGEFIKVFPANWKVPMIYANADDYVIPANELKKGLMTIDVVDNREEGTNEVVATMKMKPATMRLMGLRATVAEEVFNPLLEISSESGDKIFVTMDAVPSGVEAELTIPCAGWSGATVTDEEGYEVDAIFADGAVTFSVVGGTYIIYKKNVPTVTAPVAKELTYTGEDQALVTGGTTTGGTLQYSLDNVTYSTDIPTGKDAKTYTVWYKVEGDNYNSNVEAVSVEVTITKADATVTAPVAKELTYTGSARELITAGSTADGTLQYSLDNVTYSTDIPTGTDAGTYTVYYKVVGDANHNDVAAKSVTVTIAKAAVTVTADNKSKVYGESDPELTYSASGLVGEENLSNISVTRVSGETVGEYVITATQTDGANSNYEIIFVNGTFTITAKTSAPTIELSVETFTYDGTAKEPTVTVKDGENVIPTSEYTVAYSDNIDAGTAKVTITDVAGGNYVVNGSKTFTIGKAPLTVTANAKTITYGAAPANAGVEYKGFVNGESEDELTGTLSYNYNYEQYGDVGTYTITPAGLSSDNYEITFVKGTLTVEQKEIGIKWSNTDLTYSGEAQAPTATATGMVNEDKVTLTVSGEQTNASAEAYTATVTAVSNSNYKLPAAVTMQFTIAKAQPSYTVPTNLTATYGQTLSDVKLPADWAWVDATQSVGNVGSNKFAVEFTPEDTINYNKVSGTATITVNKQQIAKPDADNTKFAYTGVAQTYTVVESELYTVSGTTRTEAGSQTVTIALTNKENYAWVGGSSADLEYTFTIAKAPLTITANAKTITYGDAPANAGVEYKGFVNGETEAALTGTLSYNFDYKQYGNVGSYAITPAGLDAANYAITFVNGALTVGQKEIGIEWGDTELTYNGKDQAPTATATGMVNGDKVTLTVSGEQTNASAEAYTATVTAVSNSNYKLPAAVTTQFTIAKAQPSYTVPANLTATYGQTLADVELPTGWAWVDVATTSVGAVGSNKFAVEFTPADIVNYNKVSGTATITVNKQQIVKPDADNTKFVYTGVAQTYTVAASELYTVSGNTRIEAGSQTVTISLTNKESYAWIGGSSDDLQYTFTIAKAPLTITANAKSITYGAAPANAGVEYKGFVNGETEDALTGTLSYSYNYKQYGNVGTYAITPAGLSADNYEITFVNGTLTVEQKEIGIKWSNTDLTYSGKAQAPTATATGVVNGDEVTLTVSGEKTNASDVAYTATVTAVSNDNYKLPTAVTTQFTIAKAQPSYTIPVGLTATYGQTLADVELPTGWAWVDATQSVGNVGSNKFAVEFTPEDTINYNKVSGTATITVNKQQIAKPATDDTKFVYTGVVQTYTVVASPLYTVSNTTRTAAGEQTVTIALNDKTNYAWIGGSSDDLEYTFTIAKAPLTITANAKSITYGAAPANAGVSYTGFVNGETEDKLTGTLSYSYDYKQYGNVGEYVITPAGLSSDNYEITFVNGALTVGQKEIGIEWGNTDLTYSGEAQAPTATATGMVNGDEVTLAVSGEQTNIGSYTATVTGLVGDKAGNYKLPANVTTAFTVDYATVTFNTNGAGTIASIENLTYGDKIAEPSEPVKAKHTFAGWFSDEKCTKLWVFEKDTITGDMTLYAKWSENPVYDVSGIVYEQPGKDEHSQKVVANAHVQLVLGTTVVVEQTTNEDGEFFFGGQEEGDYNLVVTHRHNNSKHDKVVTVLVALHEHNADDIEVVLPKHVTNSKVEHKNNNPEVEGEPDTGIATGTLVGGLDVVAETMRKQEEQKVDTSSGNVEASEVVAKVEVTLTVEDTPPVTNPTTPEEVKVKEEQEAIQEKAPGKEIVFFDLSVIMSVTDNQDKTTESRLSDTGSLLEIRIPFEKGNKMGVVIYRYHDDQAEALPEVNEGSQTEGFWVGDDGYIHIYTHKFSTYAVGYTEPGNNTGGTPGGYYPIVTPTTPVEKPEDTKPEDTEPVVTPTTPVEDDVTPAPEDTTPVVPDAPATDDDPAVDNTPADDMTPSDSGNSVGLWIGVALAVLVVAIIVVVILIKRKKA